MRASAWRCTGDAHHRSSRSRRRARRLQVDRVRRPVGRRPGSTPRRSPTASRLRLRRSRSSARRVADDRRHARRARQRTRRATRRSTFDAANGSDHVGANAHRLGSYFDQRRSARGRSCVGDAPDDVAIVEKGDRRPDRRRARRRGAARPTPSSAPSRPPDAADVRRRQDPGRVDGTVTTAGRAPNLFVLNPATARSSRAIPDDSGAAALSVAAIALRRHHALRVDEDRLVVRLRPRDALDAACAAPIAPTTSVVHDRGRRRWPAAVNIADRSSSRGASSRCSPRSTRSTSDGRPVNVVDLDGVHRHASARPSLSARRARARPSATLGTSRRTSSLGYPEPHVDSAIAAARSRSTRSTRRRRHSTRRRPRRSTIAQPETNQQFGRSLATMKFNGEPILVVARHQRASSPTTEPPCTRTRGSSA